MTFELVHDLAPEAFDALDHLERTIESAADLSMIDLCRVRIRQLLGVPTDAAEAVDEMVRNWPRSSGLNGMERSVLAFTEQFVVDVSSITSAEVAPLLDWLGPAGLYRFTYALSAVDQIERLRISLALVLGAEF